jgi:hypothetical protein
MVLKQLLLCIFCCLLFMVTEVTLNAQPSNSQATPTPTLQRNDEAMNKEEVIALRAQLETMRQYDQRLLETVYWSLGGMFTVVIVIVGVGWYTNFRLYERDKSALRQDLLLSIKDDTRKEIESAARQAHKELREAIDPASTKSNSDLHRLSREVKGIKYDLYELETSQQEINRVYNNVLRSYIKMIEVAQAMGQDYFISRTLGDVVRVLKILANEEVTPLDGGVAKDVTKMLDSLCSEFSVDVDTVRQLLRAARAR